MGNKSSKIRVACSGISFNSFRKGRREFDAFEFEKWAHLPMPEGLGIGENKTGKPLARKATELCCGMTNQKILFVSGRYVLAQTE
ncbi:hypothetical protein A9K97_gp448 [Tokyovirus A1]|uniref:hypothetical protein n=1 Tax=Tokyovirus A1 TaxID=1826170 RepID=UPI0007A97E04|nr:hypothetical protein A9K97_gp448 [Tokyovirus A1]BAU79903.1 hypothetical protein [Tokyovirus A1]